MPANILHRGEIEIGEILALSTGECCGHRGFLHDTVDRAQCTVGPVAISGQRNHAGGRADEAVSEDTVVETVGGGESEYMRELVDSN
ncbi:MAG: hypothetical protein ABT21_06415 [Thiobacillus sp. SCN 65-179]|nr:MAG: hypothetical protein ABT21_06415 [Thiobacillus sp. SCN 65-179]